MIELTIRIKDRQDIKGFMASSSVDDAFNESAIYIGWGDTPYLACHDLIAKLQEAELWRADEE